MHPAARAGALAVRGPGTPDVGARDVGARDVGARDVGARDVTPGTCSDGVRATAGVRAVGAVRPR
ncbi:hypothetical protein [Streptomyces sp. NPDC085540]|uniref:hypothetical protein n=1 Tax=Streptomyces sp. NPDC085540 TaxID=3365730 RepID=UPI0037CD8876